MASEHAECERVLSAKDDDAILRLTSAGSIGDVRRAYRTLALAIHPDRCGHPSATAAFQRLQAAFHRVCERAGAPGLGGAPDAHAAGRAPPRAAAASAFSHASDAAFRAAGADDISSEPDGDDEGSVCNVCAAGGELLLCDGCPCAFHVDLPSAHKASVLEASKLLLRMPRRLLTTEGRTTICSI
ncbi:hypothetical protein KFE25_012594 [Diacronema lutheri]|uniref:J domain-containing protein n=1 Tax=Diacronema lutheri TaxID=2081491 RepID=A0A8J6CBM0_DIALT|nr:hypothetical protein KFE25_012594 [Diacronema lutheri]